MSEELEAANRKIASLEKTVEMKAKMLEKAKSIADDNSVAAAPKKSLRPTDSQLLDDDEDGGRRISSAEIKNLRAMLDEDERTAKPPIASANTAADSKEQPPKASSERPADNLFQKKNDRKEQKRIIPETYTVEEGDTLMRISAKFYGTNRRWRDIRDANRAVISTDGRVRVGQVIKLP
jgi:LysM repeat protein